MQHWLAGLASGSWTVTWQIYDSILHRPPPPSPHTHTIVPGYGALIYQSYDGISQISGSWVPQYILGATAQRHCISVIDF